MTAGSRAPTGSPNDTTATDLAVMQNFSYRQGAPNGNNGSAKGYPPANSYQMTDGPPPPSRTLYPTGYGAGDMGSQMVTKNGPNGVPYQVSVASTTTGDSSVPRMVNAPPPTPLDSRSHFSGLSSSGNSASAYSRSIISGASNSTGLPYSGAGAGAYAVHGGMLPNGNGGPYPGDMMAYNHRD